MQTKTLNPEQLEVLTLFASMKEFGSFELGGGTAVALHLGHRKSVDFDFFARQLFETSEIRSVFSSLKWNFRVNREQKGTLIGTLKEVLVSFFHFDYPIIGTSTPSPWGFSVLSLEDLAAMKLEAVAGRGSRRDFIDLYWICQEKMSLQDSFECFGKKFHGASFDPYHRLRSLTYFEEADREPMPVMLAKTSWDEVKRYFTAESKKLWGKALV